MARIELWSKDVEKAPDLPVIGTGQHLYLIKVNDDGTREILRC